MAFALIAHAAANGNNSVATTGGIDTTGAGLLVAAVATYSGSATVSDSKGNTWSPLTRYGAGGNKIQMFWSPPSTVGAGHTFTATSAGFSATIAVAAYSGQAATPFDAESGAAADSPGSIT